ncbi:MAG: amidohydrolase, partial [Parvularculaceae bacterium]|nr:amidohydrolase [Parvularculaceae bacterium]
MKRILMAAAMLAAVAACGKKPADPAAKAEKPPVAKAAKSDGIERPSTDPFPSTYKPYPSSPVLITGATILDGAGKRINNGAVLIEGGRIAAIGPQGSFQAPAGAATLNAAGKWVTPGIIDIHSHLGVYASPSADASSDGNEATSPNRADVWAEHSVWPQDPGFTRALAGGVTAMQILPGSANLFGGRSVVLKNVPGRTVQDMKFPGAPYGLKMACGENPKRVYGEKGGPSTRMGNVAGQRAAWIEAQDYRKKWDDYWKKAEAAKKSGKKGKAPDPPKRDLKLETLAGALRGDILVQNHCYRADEMAIVLDMAKEFGYKVTAFHHAVEAFKVADLLAKNNVCAVVWADWWGFKYEAYDSVRENAALVAAQPGGCAIIHSDDALGIQRLNQEVGKAMADGARAGLRFAPEQAIGWITANPAKALGVLKDVGTIEKGKMADVVVWTGDPFSVYSRAEKVFVDGAL